MIVKNATDVGRWMAQDGMCGFDGEFCSQSCQEHGAHVAISGGRVFARGLKPRRVSHNAIDDHEVVEGQVTQTITFDRSRIAV